MSNISFQKPDETNLEVQLFDKYLVLRLYLPLAGTAAVMLDFSKNIPNKTLYQEFSDYLPNEKLLEEIVYQRNYYMSWRSGRLLLYTEHSEELYEHMVAKILNDSTITVITHK